MTIRKFLQEKIQEGYSLNRLGLILNITPAALSKLKNTINKNPRKQLARKIYRCFGVELDGFHITELQSYKCDKCKKEHYAKFDDKAIYCECGTISPVFCHE